MRVKKFQGGGFATFTPIINAPPVQQTAAASSGGKTATSSILDDDTFKELITKGGLINDTNKLVEELIQLETAESNPFLSESTRGSALRLISKVTELRRNKENWALARSRAEETGGLGEVAVGTYGEVYTKDDKNNVVAVDLNTYKENKGDIKLLTVAELMQERELNPQLTGQNSVFNVANNSIGISKISDRIKDIVNVLGTEELSKNEFYSKEQAAKYASEIGGQKPTQSELEALNTLNQIVSTPGSDLISVKQKSSTQRAHIDKALNYIWKTLGTNAQQKLTVTAAMNGESDPRNFILNMLDFGTDESRSTEVTPASAPDGSTATNKAGEKSLTQFQMFHKDVLAGYNNSFAMNDPKMGTMFRGVIGGISPIITPDGNSIGMNTVETILNSGYNQFLKGDDIFFGNKKVGIGGARHIVYDGRDAAKVYMPVNKATGGPDYESLAQFKELNEVFEANKDHWTAKFAERYFLENGGFKVKIEETVENGKKVKAIKSGDDVKPFLVMYGYTTDDTDLVGNNEDWLNEVDDEELEAIMPGIESAWTTGKDKKGNPIVTRPPEKFWNITDYYKGIVAIPYKPEATAIVDALVDQGPRARQASVADVQRNIRYSSNQGLNRDTSTMSIINK